MATLEELLKPPEKIVKSRGREWRRYPVIAMVHDDTLDEHGNLGTVDELIRKLPTMPPTLFAVRSGSADVLAYLDEHYRDQYNSTWQWRAAANERDIVRPDGLKVAARISVVVHYFGWKGGNYHRIIDPVNMYGHRLATVYPREDLDTLRQVLGWATVLRDFCYRSGIDIRPTIGAVSAQFLTHPKFYPGERRKVPAATNERAREQMPGNHYSLFTTTNPAKEFTAYYLDQHRAHHYHARATPLPHADLLYAHGCFRNLDSCVLPDVWQDFYGLYCLDLEHCSPRPHSRAFSWYRNHERLEGCFVWTCELEHLKDMGYRITGVRAAWGSRQRDTGIPRFATWAEEQLDEYADAPWLKPLLLATYGVLATKPKYQESVFRIARTGESVRMWTGKRRLTGLQVRSSVKLEPRIANVLHRGMIEAATRSESIGLAQWLDMNGHRILSIYADAVIVKIDDDNPLPQLPEPWRIKTTLNHLQFINQQAFVSGEMTKLPGVGRDILKYRQQAPGRAPNARKFDALEGRMVKTNGKVY